MSEQLIYLKDYSATINLANSLAKVGFKSAVIYLNGNLGSGKTTFVKGFLAGLGYKKLVKSPTYNILETYMINDIKIDHFDLYRFNSDEDWIDSGFEDIDGKTSIVFIEWSQNALFYLPSADLILNFIPQDSSRSCSIVTNTHYGESIYRKWQRLQDVN